MAKRTKTAAVITLTLGNLTKNFAKKLANNKIVNKDKNIPKIKAIFPFFVLVIVPIIGACVAVSSKPVIILAIKPVTIKKR